MKRSSRYWRRNPDMQQPTFFIDVKDEIERDRSWAKSPVKEALAGIFIGEYRRLRLSQTAAAEESGIERAVLCDMSKWKQTRVSVAKLLSGLHRMGFDIEIVIRRRENDLRKGKYRPFSNGAD